MKIIINRFIHNEKNCWSQACTVIMYVLPPSPRTYCTSEPVGYIEALSAVSVFDLSPAPEINANNKHIYISTFLR